LEEGEKPILLSDVEGKIFLIFPEYHMFLKIIGSGTFLRREERRQRRRRREDEARF